MFTDDPVKDFGRWDAEQTKQLEQLPICDHCEQHIQDDYYYQINGDNICQACLDNYYRKENVI